MTEQRVPFHYLPGRFLGVLPSLEQEEYDKLVHPGQAPAATREALIGLLPHLGDEFVAQKRRKLPEGGHSRLAVFEGHRPSGTVEGFVVVTGQGHVLVGRTDTLATSEGQQLEPFRPVEHEILSITVTDRHRPVGERLDLYIVSRSFQEAATNPDKVEVYHGLIHIDTEGMPQLELAADDNGGERPTHWHPLDGSRLPRWLRSWRSGYAVGVDPLDSKLEGHDVPWPYEDQEADSVSLSTPWIGYGRGGELVLRRCGKTADSSTLLVGTEVGFLTLGREDGRTIRGVTTGDTRHLIGVEKVDQGSLEVAWRQLHPSFPADAVFLDGHTNGLGGHANGDKRRWPDLLVVFQDGTLERLQHKGRHALRTVWRALWGRLEAMDVEAKLEAARSSRGKELGWRRVAIFGAVEGVLEKLPDSSEKQRSLWIREVAQLFAEDEDHNLLVIGLHPILQCLRKAAVETWDHRSASMFGFAVELLHRIYHQQELANIEVLSRIDWIVRSINWLGDPKKLSATTRHNFDELKKHSKIHLRDVVHGLAGDDRTPQKIIRHCGSNIERWSSALTMMDTIWLGRPEKTSGEAGFQLTGVAAFKTVETVGRDRRWLAVARRGQLQIHRFDEDGRLAIEPTERLAGKGNLRVVRIPGAEGDRLLLVDALGHVRLLGVEGIKIQSSEAQEWGGGVGTPGPIQALLRDDGSSLVALTCSRGRATTLGLLKIDGDRIDPVNVGSIAIHEISCLDLALQDDGSVLLLVASSLGGIVKLFSVSATDGTFREFAKYRPAGGVSLAARFERRLAPKYCLVGDNKGFLWCGNLEAQSKAGRLKWSFRFDTAVRAILPLDFKGELHFLAGSEAGKLALIRGRDARRVWTERMLSPVRQLDGFGENSDGIVVVAMQGGWLSTFCLESKREELLTAVYQDLEGLRVLEAREDKSLWRSSDAKAVAAFYDLAHRAQGPASRSLAKIVRNVCGRERRARVLRFLSEKLKPPIREDCEAVLDELSFRDLYRLLAYLPDDAVFCDEQVVARLQQRNFSRVPGSEDSYAFAMQVQVAALQRLDSRKPKVSDVLAAQPQDLEWLTDRWVSIEMSRILLQALVNERPVDPSQRILPLALPHLLRLPESMVEVCADVLEDGKEDAEDFHALYHLVRDLVKVGRAELKDLERLQIRLSKLDAVDPTVALMAAIGGFFLSYRRLQDEQERGEESYEQIWKEVRLEILESLGALILRCGSEDGDGRRSERGAKSEEHLFDFLGELLPRTPIPGDTRRQRERLDWWGTFHQDILGEEGPPKNLEGPWQKPVAACLWYLRECLQRIVEWEIKHVRSEVRYFVEAAGSLEIDANRRVYLPLRLFPEGRSVLSDVSVRVDVGRQGGLLPPSPVELFKIIHLNEMGTDSEPIELEFQGYASKNQRYVRVWTTLESGEGYRHRQAWKISLPEPRRHVEGQNRIGPFRKAVELTLERSLDNKAAVVLAVVDDVFGRQTFIQGWSRATHGRLVDLDEALQETGKGRIYSERSLSLELLEEVLGLVGRNGDTKPVLVTSTAQTIQRLLDREVPGLLPEWVAWLRTWASEKGGRPIVLLVSSTHACFLRSLGLGNIAEIRAHHVVAEARKEHILPDGDALDGLIQAVRDATQLDSGLALRRIEQLGGDLYLIACWLLWVAVDPARGTRELREFLGTRQVKARVGAELASLSGFDLLVALVGSLAEVTVPLSQARAGLIAARNYHSTTYRSQPKRVQNRGEPFTDRSLHNLESDARPPERVRIEGFGTLGTASAQGTNLLGLTASRGETERKRSFERLQVLGIGTWSEGIYRTADPYRSYIRDIYETLKADVPLQKRDGEVYKRLFGGERSPLESLSLFELSNLPQAQLKSLLPSANVEDIAVLPELAKLWQDDSHTEQNLISVFQRVYRERAILPISSQSARWDQALASLDYLKFGVGHSFVDEETRERYPVGYHFWIEKGGLPEIAPFGEAIEHTSQNRHLADVKNDKERDPREGPEKIRSTWTPRVVLMGPGAEDMARDPERRVAIIKERDICQNLAEGCLGEELLRSARAQLKLTAISPFQTSGPIPPGSPFFFGRHEEMSFIESNLRRASILIVGSRRVGKTSLLNQVRHWARKQPDLEPIYVDLQRVSNQKEFNKALKVALSDVETSEELQQLAGKVTSLRDLVQKVRKLGRLPVFLFNEIDGLATHSLIGDWRALNEEKRARFVMVAYSTVAELGKVDGPFFHFTVGTSFGGRAIAPTALSREAAENLLGVLTGEELGLRWASPAQEKQAIRKLLDRSYRIPWVLQHFGQLLLSRLEKARRGIITLDDVDTLLAENGDVVWLFIESLDYESLDSQTSKGSRRPGYQLVLFCLARERYFLGKDPMVHEPRLRDRSALDPKLGFTVDEAREVVKATVSELLDAEERDKVHRYFDRLELDKALRLLTLTLALETDPEYSDRYGFLMHILPLELKRRYSDKGSTLDDLIIDTAVKFLGFLS